MPPSCRERVIYRGILQLKPLQQKLLELHKTTLLLVNRQQAHYHGGVQQELTAAVWGQTWLATFVHTVSFAQQETAVVLTHD
jgi:hypothetical protein